jgi:hypothetical protein
VDSTGVPSVRISYVVPPSVVIASPADGGVYARFGIVYAGYTCTAGAGTAVSSCSAPVANATPVDTATPGRHRFTVTASDADGGSTTRSVTYTVTAAPNPNSPTCQSVSAIAIAGRPAIVPLRCSESTGAALTYALDSTPAHGALSAFNPHTGEVTYTSAAGYSGPDSFTYHAVSANGTATARPVSITVKRASGRSLPAITRASVSHSRFRVARGATAISAAKAPHGTSFRFTLSVIARLQITITHPAPGLRGARRCLAPSPKLKRMHAKSCTRAVTAGRLTRARVPSGADSVPFTGRIGTRALTPGSYDAVLVATDASGRSRPVTVTFAVVR